MHIAHTHSQENSQFLHFLDHPAWSALQCASLLVLGGVNYFAVTKYRDVPWLTQQLEQVRDTAAQAAGTTRVNRGRVHLFRPEKIKLDQCGSQ